MEKTEQVVSDRSKVYGDFTNFAELQVTLEQSCIRHMHQHNPDSVGKMAPFVMEGLHMVIHKICRIVNGDPSCEDSWRDIAGYATLVADRVHLIQDTPLATQNMTELDGHDRPREEAPQSTNESHPHGGPAGVGRSR